MSRGFRRGQARDIVSTSALASRRRMPTPVELLQRYPVTAAVSSPYIALILPIAVLNDNPQTGFIVRVLSLALVGALVVETLLLPLPTPGTYVPQIADAKASSADVFAIARLTAIVAIAADVMYAALGGGTIVTQVGGAVQSSTLVNLVKLPSSWKYVSVGLLIVSYLRGHVSRGGFLRWTATLLGAQVVVAYLTAITSAVISYAVFVAFTGTLFGIIRIRQVVVGTAVLLLLWPTIFAVRNDLRESSGFQVATEVSAGDRLRFDLQVTQAATHQVPVDVGQPGITEILAYGLVPRALDPDRPPVATSAKINRYLYGNEKSSYSFLPLGDLYFLEGPLAVSLFYGVWALIVALLLRYRGGPGSLRASLLCLAMALPLGWFSIFPDSVIGFLQGAVAALPVYGVLWWRARTGRGRRMRSTRWYGSASGRHPKGVTTLSGRVRP
jgi:hypothetical protein